MAAAACALVFRLRLNFTTDLPCLLLAVAAIPLGLAFMAAYRYGLGMLAFRYLDITFILYLDMSFVAFVTGAFVPLALLPAPVLAFLRFLPFTHVVYTPAMLVTGQMNSAEGLFGLAVLLVWTVFIVLFAQAAYRKLRTQYDGVGI